MKVFFWRTPTLSACMKMISLIYFPKSKVKFRDNFLKNSFNVQCTELISVCKETVNVSDLISNSYHRILTVLSGRTLCTAYYLFYIAVIVEFGLR